MLRVASPPQVFEAPIEARPSAPKHRLLPLTALRGLAAWWVVLFHFKHFLNPYLPIWGVAFISRGDLAVDLFFCLSGFVLYVNYHRLSITIVELRKFYLKRVARLYPLHLLMLCVYVGFAIILVRFSSSHTVNARFSPHLLVPQLLLMQDWGTGEPLSWNVPAWSISAEFAAYLLFPFLLRWLDWRRAGSIRLTAYAVLAVGALTIAFGSGHSDLGANIDRLGVLRCVMQFIVGMTVGEIYIRRNSSFASASWPLLGAAGMMFLLVFRLHLWTVPVIPLAWACLMAGLAFNRGFLARVFSIGALVVLGECSYATYMCHYLFYDVFKLVFVGNDMTASALAIAVTFIAIGSCSVLLYRYIELPCKSHVLKAPSRCCSIPR